MTMNKNSVTINKNSAIGGWVLLLLAKASLFIGYTETLTFSGACDTCQAAVSSKRLCTLLFRRALTKITKTPTEANTATIIMQTLAPLSIQAYPTNYIHKQT